MEGRDEGGLLDMDLWHEVRGHERWAEMLGRPLPEEVCRAVRAATFSGLPLGSEEFVSRLERQFGRRLRPGRPGPRPKEAAVGA